MRPCSRQQNPRTAPVISPPDCDPPRHARSGLDKTWALGQTQISSGPGAHGFRWSKRRRLSVSSELTCKGGWNVSVQANGPHRRLLPWHARGNVPCGCSGQSSAPAGEADPTDHRVVLHRERDDERGNKRRQDCRRQPPRSPARCLSVHRRIGIQSGWDAVLSQRDAAIHARGDSHIKPGREHEHQRQRKLHRRHRNLQGRARKLQRLRQEASALIRDLDAHREGLLPVGR